MNDNKKRYGQERSSKNSEHRGGGGGDYANGSNFGGVNNGGNTEDGDNCNNGGDVTEEIEIKTKARFTEAPVEILREFNMSGNERKFEQIIADLKFLAKVKPNQKINVSTKQIVSSENYADRIHRTYLQVEGKKTTITFVRDVITAAIDQMFFFNNLKHQFYHKLADIIREQITLAKVGITGLATTYSENDSISSEMEAIVTSIDAKLQI